MENHPGREVSRKDRHRDPIRTSHGDTARRHGHKWVVLAVLVRFLWTTRSWILPVLVDLDHSEEDDRARRRPQRTRGQPVRAAPAVPGPRPAG